MKLFYRKKGNGPPLIIIHGLLGSSDNWMTISKSFAEHFSVFMIDLRNHGRSPHSEAFSVDAMMDDLLEFMKDQQLNFAAILGHSLGGWIAMNFAVHYPKKVDKLIVVDFAPKKYQNNLIGFLNWLLNWDISRIKSLREADQQLAEIFKEQAVRGFIMKNLKRKKNDGFDWKPNLKAIYNDLDQESGHLDKGQMFEKPTLFIRGGNSDYIKSQDESLIKEHFPNVTIKTVSVAGHWVHADNPDELVRVVNQFLR
jgi:esterase